MKRMHDTNNTVASSSLHYELLKLLASLDVHIFKTVEDRSFQRISQ